MPPDATPRNGPGPPNAARPSHDRPPNVLTERARDALAGMGAVAVVLNDAFLYAEFDSVEKRDMVMDTLFRPLAARVGWVATPISLSDRPTTYCAARVARPGAMDDR